MEKKNWKKLLLRFDIVLENTQEENNEGKKSLKFLVFGDVGLAR